MANGLTEIEAGDVRDGKKQSYVSFVSCVALNITLKC
jgi:hypothetical protein